MSVCGISVLEHLYCFGFAHEAACVIVQIMTTWRTKYAWLVWVSMSRAPKCLMYVSLRAMLSYWPIDTQTRHSPVKVTYSCCVFCCVVQNVSLLRSLRDEGLVAVTPAQVSVLVGHGIHIPWLPWMIRLISSYLYYTCTQIWPDLSLSVMLLLVWPGLPLFSDFICAPSVLSVLIYICT